MCDELNDLPGPVHKHRAFEARRRWWTRTYPSVSSSLRVSVRRDDSCASSEKGGKQHEASFGKWASLGSTPGQWPLNFNAVVRGF